MVLRKLNYSFFFCAEMMHVLLFIFAKKNMRVNKNFYIKVTFDFLPCGNAKKRLFL